MTPPATLLQFARANDAAAATPKKLQKQAALGEYFRGLEEPDLRLAVRFAAGRAFAATDERVLNVGGAIVSEAVLALLKLDPHEFHDLVVASGEIGEALSKVWPSPPPPHPGTPTPRLLADLSAAFDLLAATGVREAKRQRLVDLFTRCADGREAAYLSKIIFGDLRTGVQEGVLQAAVAQAFGKTLAEVQRCQLLVGDLDEVAVLAKNNALDVARFRLFHPIQFMLATPQESPDHAAGTMAGRAFYAEDKLDGYRAQVHKSGDGDAARVVIYTRTLDHAEDSFPDVVDAVRRLPGEFLLDGEIVPYRDGQVLPFAHIQKRLGRKKPPRKVIEENPAAFIAFDILYRDGRLLMDCPLRARREQLNALAAGTGCGVSSSPAPAPGAGLLLINLIEVSTPEQIAQTFAAARDRRNEGVVLKDPDSVYSPGRRGQAWLKIKTHLPTFDCVVTAAEYGHGRRRNWLSDYTFAVWDRDPALPDAKLVNVGKAYSGVTDEELGQLTELFHQLSKGRYGRVHVVEPKLVLEIACDQIQRSARHASGYALRFPRIKRVRWDKRPEDADRVERVAEIYQSTPNFARPVEAAVAAATAEPAAPEPVKPKGRKRKVEKPVEPTLFD